MAAVVTMDTVSGAQLDAELTKKRRVRTGIVSNIPLSTGAPDALVLEKAVDALIAAGYIFTSAIPGADPTCGLKRYSMRAIDGMVNMVKFALIYETPDFGGTPSAHIVRNAAVSQIEETNRQLDGTAIKVKWASDSDTFGDNAIEDLVSFRVFRPWRMLQVSALIYGNLEDVGPSDGGNDKADFNDYVNNATWMGKPAGWWLLKDFSTDTTNFGYYSVTTAALARGKDWSEYQTLFNRHTGQYVKVKDANETAAIGRNYSPGIIWPKTSDDKFSGLVRWGPYPWTDFSAIFGF